jgi:N6-adenosine-specific RNA methylase IME4
MERNLPVVFDGLRATLARAEKVGDAKGVRDRAEAVRIYAKQAGFGLDMQNDAAEIKLWAERRAGELIPQQFPHGGDRRARLHDETLNGAGITKVQSHRWQAIASLPEEEFAGHIAKTKAAKKELTQSGLIRLALHSGHYQSNHKKAPAFPAGTYDVMYADPPWRFDDRVPSRSVERNYPSVPTDEIKAFRDSEGRSVRDLTHGETVLFLWAVNSMLPEALEVISAWGFGYKSMMVWIKPGIGLGWYVRGQHECLLIGTKGKSHPPDPANRPSSVIQAPAGTHSDHSAKPEVVYELIDSMYPGKSKIELFGRRRYQGWSVWGNEPGID